MRNLPAVIEWPADPPILIAVTRSKRAKRLSLRVSRLDGAVKLTVPARGSARAAMDFLHERSDWLKQAVSGIAGPERVGLGTLLPIEGRPLRLVAGYGKRARIEQGELHVPEARPAAAAMAFVKAHARERLAERVAFYADRLGQEAGKLTLRDTRSRWGSCTSRGDLMFNWRLAMAPPEVLDYVAAHEVAHLIEMNHSAAFWAQVARIYPDYEPMRRWLKTEGPALHRFVFTAA